MSSDKDPQIARGSLRLAPASSALEVEKAKLPRQFVNFTFSKRVPNGVCSPTKTSSAAGKSSSELSMSFAHPC